jgi:dTDP-4-amino-4,6-dideoxygalactose transaminase
VFVDVREDTLNIDEQLLEAAVTPRTRAIVVVHYAGVGCDMVEITRIATKYGLAVVEDNAHGLFGRFQGQWLGTFAPLATLSFHETKNFSCGEGGALVINDPQLVSRAEIIREKGTDRSKFLRGEVDKYTWLDVGSSYVPSDLLAAFLFGQLEQRRVIESRRREIFEQYELALGPWAIANGVKTLTAGAGCEHPRHLFLLRFPEKSARDEFIDRLRGVGILAVSHYVPLHLSPVGRRYGYRRGDLPVTERVSDEVVRLPFFVSLTPEEQQTVILRTLAWKSASDTVNAEQADR